MISCLLQDSLLQLLKSSHVRHLGVVDAELHGPVAHIPHRLLVVRRLRLVQSQNHVRCGFSPSNEECFSQYALIGSMECHPIYLFIDESILRGNWRCCDA